MLDLTFLRTFLAIYRTGSLTKAAEQLHMTQPGVSQHLKALEVQAGRPLFVRHSRGVRPSPAGDELAQRIVPHLDALEAIGESIRTTSSGMTGTVYLGGPLDLLASTFIPALHELVEQGLRVVIRTGSDLELVELLQSAELDMIVTFERVDRPHVRYEPVWHEEPILVSGRRWAKRLPNDDDGRKRAFARGPFVGCSDEMPITRWVLKELYDVEPSGLPAIVVGDLRATAAAVAGGAGIAVMPRHLVQDLIARGDLVVHPPLRHASSLMPMTMFLAYRPGTLHAPRVAAVRSLLLRTVRGVDELAPQSEQVRVG